MLDMLKMFMPDLDMDKIQNDLKQFAQYVNDMNNRTITLLNENVAMREELCYIKERLNNILALVDPDQERIVDQQLTESKETSHDHGNDDNHQRDA